MRRFRLHAFGFIIYLVLVLLKIALVNFTLNEYVIMMMISICVCNYWPTSVSIKTEIEI